MEQTLKEAIKVLQKHLREDKSEGSYYSKLEKQLGEAFYNFGLDFVDMETPIENYLYCSNAAKNFLDNLIKE